MTRMASDRIRRRTRTRTDGGGVCPFSHIAFHSHVFRRHAAGSNPAAGAWPDRQRRPHPRFVQLSWGVGTMGAIICCHGAQRSGSYQSRSREEPMKEILPHWRFGPNSPVKDVGMERMTRGDRAVAEACRRAMESETWKELVILECVLSSCYRPVWREFSFRKSGRF